MLSTFSITNLVNLRLPVNNQCKNVDDLKCYFAYLQIYNTFRDE